MYILRLKRVYNSLFFEIIVMVAEKNHLLYEIYPLKMFRVSTFFLFTDFTQSHIYMHTNGWKIIYFYKFERTIDHDND